MTRPVIDRNTLAKRLTEVRASRDAYRKRVSRLEYRLKRFSLAADELFCFAANTGDLTLKRAARRLKEMSQ